MPVTAAPLSIDTVVVTESRKFTRYFQNLWRDLNARVEAMPFVAPGQIAQLNAQSAAIPATALVVLTAQPLYRVSISARVATPAGVASSVQPFIGWTQDGIPQTRNVPAITGNTTTSEDGLVRLIRPDGGTVITYGTNYASNPAGAMIYELDAAAEGLG